MPRVSRRTHCGLAKSRQSPRGRLPFRARRRPSGLVFLTGNVIPWTLVRPTTRLDQLIEQDFDLIQLHLLDRRTRYAFARPGPEISGLQMSAGDGVALAPADEEDVGRD